MASVSAIIFCIVSILLSVGVPMTGMIYLAIKKKLSFKAVAVGVFLYVIFAEILEQLLHVFVLGMNYQESYIYKSPILFMLYGGLSAGIFEETARLIGFRFLLKVKDNESGYTGLSYGFGHGGFESVMTGGIASIYNLIMLFMINSGALSKLIVQDPANADTVNKTIEAMTGIPDYNFLLTGVERFAALVIQISLSLIVLKAVKEKKLKYFFYAVIMHAVVDFPAVLVQRGTITNLVLCEMVIGIIAAAYAVFAYRICWQQQEQ